MSDVATWKTCPGCNGTGRVCAKCGKAESKCRRPCVKEFVTCEPCGGSGVDGYPQIPDPHADAAPKGGPK